MHSLETNWDTSIAIIKHTPIFWVARSNLLPFVSLLLIEGALLALRFPLVGLPAAVAFLSGDLLDRRLPAPPAARLLLLRRSNVVSSPISSKFSISSTASPSSANKPEPESRPRLSTLASRLGSPSPSSRIRPSSTLAKRPSAPNYTY